MLDLILKLNEDLTQCLNVLLIPHISENQLVGFVDKLTCQARMHYFVALIFKVGPESEVSEVDGLFINVLGQYLERLLFLVK